MQMNILINVYVIIGKRFQSNKNYGVKMFINKCVDIWMVFCFTHVYVANILVCINNIKQLQLDTSYKIKIYHYIHGSLHTLIFVNRNECTNGRMVFFSLRLTKRYTIKLSKQVKGFGYVLYKNKYMFISGWYGSDNILICDTEHDMIYIKLIKGKLNLNITENVLDLNEEL
eukprot:40385_1